MTLLVAPLVACTGSGSEASPDAAADQATPVEVLVVERREVVETVRGETTLRSATELRVLAELPGTVDEVHVWPGDAVARGADLVTIANPDVRLQITDARRSVELQQRELDAVQPLFEQGYLARQQWDEATFRLQSARTALSRLQTQLTQGRVRAPMAGRVAARLVEPGQVVSVGAALVELHDPAHLVAELRAPERELRRLRVGQAARVVFPALGDDVDVPAQLERLEPAVDATSGTIGVRVRLERDTTADGTPLVPGMYCRVEVETARRADAVVIPRAAVVQESGQSAVFIVPPGAGERPVERRVVTTGWEGGGVVEVVDGLEAGELLVTVGQSRLRAGTPVRVVELP